MAVSETQIPVTQKACSREEKESEAYQDKNLQGF